MTSVPKSSVEDCKKITKSYVDRIRREEDDDHWISGEELYTEGSSEEDVGKKGSGDRPRRQAKRDRVRPKSSHYQFIKSSQTSSASVPSAVTGTMLNESAPNTSEQSPGFTPNIDGDSDSAEEEPPPPVSWKPKRGSIRLPNTVLDVNDDHNNNMQQRLRKSKGEHSSEEATNANIAASSDSASKGSDDIPKEQ